MKDREYRKNGFVIDRQQEMLQLGYNEYRSFFEIGDEDMVLTNTVNLDKPVVMFTKICKSGIVERVTRVYPRNQYTMDRLVDLKVDGLVEDGRLRIVFNSN